LISGSSIFVCKFSSFPGTSLICSSEPTSVPKSASILSAIETFLGDAGPAITFTSPNVLELVQLYHTAQNIFEGNAWWAAVDSLLQETQFNVDLERLMNYRADASWPPKSSLAVLEEKSVLQMALKLLSFFQHIILKCGSMGVVTIFRIPADPRDSGWIEWKTSIEGQCITGAVGPLKDTIVLQHFPALALNKDRVINCTGAGDSLVGSILASLLEEPLTFQHPHLLNKAMHYAQHAAILSLQSPLAVSPELSTRKSV
jgi:pseudouridylate synthase / pseudouridine kinase